MSRCGGKRIPWADLTGSRAGGVRDAGGGACDCITDVASTTTLVNLNSDPV